MIVTETSTKAKTTVSDELRRLIAHNQEMESRLQALQQSVAGMRADFEQVIAARIRELEVIGSETDASVGVG